MIKFPSQENRPKFASLLQWVDFHEGYRAPFVNVVIIIVIIIIIF